MKEKYKNHSTFLSTSFKNNDKHRRVFSLRCLSFDRDKVTNMLKYVGYFIK